MIKIKVVGVGGSGGNAINRMMGQKIRGAELIAVNTDEQDLKKIKAHKTLRIGRKLTRGLGCGMNPELGRLAADENRQEIAQLLRGADLVFVACGLGGGTGSGAAPVVAEIAKSQGALTVGMFTKPFSFEGAQRMRIANFAIEQLKEKLDTLLVIPNDKILSLADQNTTLTSALLLCDDILRQGVQGISDLIFSPGIINVDFADIKSIMTKSGNAIFGIGKYRGERKIENAVRMAINSPLIDFSVEGAKGILFNIAGGNDLSLADVEEASILITKAADREAKVIFGATRDPKLKNEEVKIIVIATGIVQR